MQTAVGVDRDVASAPTLCRLEKWADRATALRLHQVLVEQFIASFKDAPEELVLDFDATDNPLFGQQEGRFFHGYYDEYCYLPLYVFCGQQLLCAYLRPSRIDGAQHAAAILKLLVKRLRQQWPQVRIVFRGDSGFCRQRILNYCERAGVHYIIGLARNPRLQQITEFLELAMNDAFEHTGLKQREIGQFVYAANTWKRERRVITRLECGAQGNNPRYVVTTTWQESPRPCTTTCTASAGRPRTASRRHRWDCLPRAPVATNSRATSCACCWPPWATC